MTELAAIFACILLIGLTIFQLLLIIGQPLGRYAWGGNHEVLPLKYRISSVVSIILYVVFAAIISERAGLLSLIGHESIASAGIWVLTGYFFIGILLNSASRSKAEKRIMVPIAALLFFLCGIVALG